jgi:hypothetical protein
MTYSNRPNVREDQTHQRLTNDNSVLARHRR